MSPPVRRAADWSSQSFSMIIDVRSGSELADDHIPDAVSMPVPDDEERAETGTMYKQAGAFESKRRGVGGAQYPATSRGKACRCAEGFCPPCLLLARRPAKRRHGAQPRRNRLEGDACRWRL